MYFQLISSVVSASCGWCGDFGWGDNLCYHQQWNNCSTSENTTSWQTYPPYSRVKLS